MPFKSDEQRRACWAQYARDKKAGRKPSWDCREFERVTTYITINGKKKVVRTGPRGGRYVMVNGTKRYI